MKSDSQILVTGYVNPDLDAYGCALAYAELLRLQGSGSEAAAYGQPLAEVQFVQNLIDIPKLQALPAKNFDQVVVVDTNRSSNIDPSIDCHRVVEVIDHRQGGQVEDFPQAQWQVELVGAAATLVAERFVQRALKPTPSSAAFLLAAITSNTLLFKNSLTTERDLHMADWLASIARLESDFSRQLFMAKSDVSGVKLAEQLRGDLSVLDPVNGLRVGIGQLEMLESKPLLEQRQDEILALLAKIQDEQSLDYIFTSILDINDGLTYFVTADGTMQQLLKQALAVQFAGSVACYPRLIMRKEYFVDLKRVLAS